jgi:hypothetical protein
VGPWGVSVRTRLRIEAARLRGPRRSPDPHPQRVPVVALLHEIDPRRTLDPRGPEPDDGWLRNHPGTRDERQVGSKGNRLGSGTPDSE